MTLFDKYGGQSTVNVLVEYFYNHLVLKDNYVKHFFDGIDMNKQIQKQSSFIAFALGGPKEYSGKTMKESHKHLLIENGHFDRIIQHLKTTLQVHGVEESDILLVENKLLAFRKDIVSINNNCKCNVF